MNRRALLVLLTFGLVHTASAGTQPEPERIEFLISAVADLDDAVFIRNGAEHDPGEAAGHLRYKRSKAGSRVRTADQFIQGCATASSVSGQRYSIRFHDGRTVDVAAWLREKLAEFDAQGAH